MSDRKIDGVKWLTHPWSGQHFYNLLVANINTDTIETLNNVRSFSSNINTKMDEGPATFSNDTSSIIFSTTVSKSVDVLGNNLTKKEVGDLQLQYANFDISKGEWSKPQSFSLQDSLNTIEHPAISWDGQVLLFSSDHEFPI